MFTKLYRISIKVIVYFSLSLTNCLSSYCGFYMLYIQTKSIVFEPRQILDKLQEAFFITYKCHVSTRVEEKTIDMSFLLKKYQTTPHMRTNRSTLFKCVFFSQKLLQSSINFIIPVISGIVSGFARGWQSAHPCPVSMSPS